MQVGPVGGVADGAAGAGDAGANALAGVDGVANEVVDVEAEAPIAAVAPVVAASNADAGGNAAGTAPVEVENGEGAEVAAVLEDSLALMLEDLALEDNNALGEEPEAVHRALARLFALTLSE